MAILRHQRMLSGATSTSTPAMLPRCLARPGRCAPLRARRQSPILAAAQTATSPQSTSGSAGKEQPGNVYEQVISCPLGAVQAVMRPLEAGLLTVTPNQTLQQIIPILNQVTGVPVLDPDTGKVVGVISRKDIIRVRKANGSMSDMVAKHMTSPALTVAATTPVQEAAELMLSNNIRRLPVVDKDGRPVGLVARSNIFKPLGSYAAAMQSEIAAMQGWQVKYLFDGDCPMCSSMKALLERQDAGKGRILFVNIADDDYNPTQNMGITYDEAMTTIHAIRPDGAVEQGTDAIKAMYAAVGLGWLIWLMEQPLLTQLVEVFYEFVSKNRLSLGSSMDVLLAGKKLDMSKQGVTTCADVDEECSVEW